MEPLLVEHVSLGFFEDRAFTCTVFEYLDSALLMRGLLLTWKAQAFAGG